MTVRDEHEEGIVRAFISCIPGKLAYFEPENDPDRCILQA